MGELRRPTYTTTDPRTGERITHGSRVWWIRYYRNGRRHEESSGSTRKSDAERLLRLREGAIAKGEAVSAEVGRLTFDQAAADVVRDYRFNGKRTLGHLERRLNLHLLPFFGGRRLASIDTAAVRAYCEHRQDQGAANGTINRELTVLKRAFKLAEQAGKVLHRPYVPMLREADPRSGFFERTEFEDVRAALPEHLRGVATFAYLTGWRVPSEILPLRWRQVDRPAKVIRLEPGTTKNREARTLPYGSLPELVDVVETAWREHERLARAGTLCPYVFHHRGGQRIGAFRKAWETACRRAGVPGRLLHDFRRTAVRNLVRAGVPDTVAMAITGHKTRSVFDRYNITAEADLRDALAKLSSSVRDSAMGKEKGKMAESGRVVDIVSR
jgi:integrase